MRSVKASLRLGVCHSLTLTNPFLLTLGVREDPLGQGVSLQCLNEIRECLGLHSYLAPANAWEGQVDGSRQASTSAALTFLGISKTLALLQMPLPSLTRPRHPELWDQSWPPPALWQSRLAAEAAWRRCQMVTLRGQTLSLVGKALPHPCPTSKSWLYTKDRIEYRRREESVHPGLRGPNVHKDPVLLPKQHKKAPRRPRVRGGEAGGCDQV